jgi:hypothetical protein
MPVAKEQDEIFRAALSLPEEIRAVLAERLLESLDSAGLSALMTEDYLEALARQGDRAAFDRVLVNVPAVPPDPWDRWNEPEAAGSSGRDRDGRQLG